MQAGASRIPHEKLDARLRRLVLRVRHPVEHMLAGEYRSVFKGSGMDFDELRHYEPGDDVRAIDWNVSARTGSPHVKRFIEERELAVWIVLDVSASCRIRPGAKPDTLVEAGAMLALAALRNNDRVGLIAFSDRVESLLPARKGLRHGLRILDSMERCKPEGTRTDPAPALDVLGHFVKRHALVALLSDFQFTLNRGDIARAGFRQELVAIAVNDPAEISPPACGLAEVEDVETAERVLCDMKPNHREKYHAAFTRRRQYLRGAISAIGADLVEIRAGDDPATALSAFFRHRIRRVAGEAGGSGETASPGEGRP